MNMDRVDWQQVALEFLSCLKSSHVKFVYSAFKMLLQSSFTKKKPFKHMSQVWPLMSKPVVMVLWEKLPWMI